MHQAIKYNLDKSVLTSHYEETLSKVFTVNKVHLHLHLQNQQIQLRFRSTQRWSSSPKNNVKKFVLYAILLHDINYIIVLSYEFHIIFNCLIIHVSLVVCLLFHEGKQKFLQTVLVQEDEEETVTLLRETEIYF